jgi:hypothetical protein
MPAMHFVPPPQSESFVQVSRHVPPAAPVHTRAWPHSLSRVHVAALQAPAAHVW